MNARIDNCAALRTVGTWRARFQRRFPGWLLTIAASILLNACASSSTGPSPVEHGMRLSASVNLVHGAAGDTVRAVLTIQNVSASSQQISWGGCGPLLLLASKADGNTALAWNSQDANSNRACVDIAYVKTLSPGESWHYADAVPVASILGDTLPIGMYSFHVSAKFLDPSLPAQIPAGTLSLTR